MYSFKAVFLRLFLFGLSLSLSSTLATRTEPRSSPARYSHFFSTQSIRLEQNEISQQQHHVVLLQEEGSVDTVQLFLIELPSQILPEDVIFEQRSTDENVLRLAGNNNLYSSASADKHLNVTCSLSFDDMVGKTDYHLIAKQKSTGIVIKSFTVHFIIVGVTFYTEYPAGNITIVSGESRSFVISTEHSIENPPTLANHIKVFIQYPDGSSSISSDVPEIRYGESLSISIDEIHGEIMYEAPKCDIRRLGTLTNDGQIKYPDSCGCGFYKDETGSLSFGFNFQPYRAGSLRIRFSWSGLTHNNVSLSEETFLLSLNVRLIGMTSVVVQEVKPESGLLRSEGGQYVQCKILNSDHFNITSFLIRVENVSTPFSTVPGSYKFLGPPLYEHEISFMSEPGIGNDLNWTLFYNSSREESSQTLVEVDEAMFSPGFKHTFTYDDENIRIDGITPEFGNEEGGYDITIEGYFPAFNIEKDGVYFKDRRIPTKSITSVTNTSIVFLTPSRNELGQSYEYYVSIHIGKAISNAVLFSFILTKANIRISQTGTSEIDAETFKFGDCAAARFTAVVTPFTNQIQSYQWSLHAGGNFQINILESSDFKEMRTDVQTIEIEPQKLQEGIFSLSLIVKLRTVEIVKKIDLLRERHPNIGAFILDTPERTISKPNTPLRLFAVVREPDQCGGNGDIKIVENRTMMVEWEAFGVSSRFSSADAFELPPPEKLSHPVSARLGWEFIVPKHNLTTGVHDIVFKVWLAEQEEIRGQAMSQVKISDSSLVAVIRHGEEYVTVSKNSILTMFATNSYDPDVYDNSKHANLTYHWFCRQSSIMNFSETVSSPCFESFRIDENVSSSEIPFKSIEATGSIKFIKYSLIVEKGDGRVSQEETLVVEIQDGSKPHIDEFTIQLFNGNGVDLDKNQVPHNDPVEIFVSSTEGTTWSYELLEPSIPHFFSKDYLVNNTDYYYVSEDALFPHSDSKPLGIIGGRLLPSTEYLFKITFESGTSEEITETFFSFRTTEAPIIGFPTPTITEGTVATTLTATAGTSSMSQTVAYYFILEDSDGNKFCTGGCTGSDVIYYRIGRPGKYILSAYMYDMEGKTILDSATLEKQIVIEGSMQTEPFQAQLRTLFLNGNDNYWTQLANEVSVILLRKDLSGDEKKLLPGIEKESESSQEDIIAARMDLLSEIAKEARSIHCSSYPNTYHGKQCIDLAHRILQQDLLHISTVYDVMVSMLCCVKNTPIGTTKLTSEVLPQVLTELHRLARNLYQGGSSRRRLLATSTKRDNLGADIHTWTIDCLTESDVLDQPHGSYKRTFIGDNGEEGELTVVAASNPSHLQPQPLENSTARIIKGQSDVEAFFIRDECLKKVFSNAGGKTLYFGYYATDNFVVGGNFNGPPIGTNLVDKLYWVKIFSVIDGRFTQIGEMKDDCCFCWILPVVREQEFLHESTEYMPGIYAFKNLKKFQEDVPESNAERIYDYDFDGSKTDDYDSLSGWVVGCREDVGLVGSTIVSQYGANSLVSYSGSILGIPHVMGVALIIGALVMVVVALVAGWLIAVRAVSDNTAPITAHHPGEMYVERDVYGRGSIFNGSAEATNT